MRTPILETQRLILRPLRMEDVNDVYDGWESDPEVAKYMLWTSHNEISKTREWLEFETSKIEADDWYRWGFEEKGTGNLVGTGLIYLEEEFGLYEIGYNLGKEYWGEGFTTEAMTEVIRFAKEELKLTELVARHAKENNNSERVLKKLGFLFDRDCPYECNNGTVMMEGKMHILKL
jgi:ribosomal-protein-alanine N-acetyltransferase